MIRRIITRVKEAFTDYRSLFYSNWALKQYNAKRYDALPKKLSTFNRYRWVNLGDYPLLFFLIDENNPESLRKFLAGAKYREQAMHDEDNPLGMNPVQFAYMSWQPEVIDVLKEFGANPHIRNSKGQNLLHLAAMGSKEFVFKQAIKEEVEIDAQDTYKNTPMHYAARAANLEILRILLEKGARKDIANIEEKYPVHMAVESQNIDAVGFLQDSIDTLKYENTYPMHLAASLPDIHILRLLIQHNRSHIYASDKQGLTPLHYAVIGNSIPNLTEILLNGPQIDKADCYGNTALHLATLENKLECARVLLQNGANPLLKNIDKLTPVDCAFNVRSQELLRHFRELGNRQIEEQYFSTRM